MATITAPDINAMGPMILGARVYLAAFSGSTVSSTVRPVLPTEEGGADKWTRLGKIRTAKPIIDYKTTSVEGVNDAGVYETEEYRIATNNKLQFGTNSVSKEALALSFGLAEGADKKLHPYAGARNEIDCWLALEITDSLKQGGSVACVTLCGRLRLMTPLNIASDASLVEFELIVKSNPLSTWTEATVVA